LARTETFGFVALLLMLDSVTWTDRKIWPLRSADYVGRWKSHWEGKGKEGGEGVVLKQSGFT